MFLAFVDFNVSNPVLEKKSKELLQQLIPVQEKFGHIYNFYFCGPELHHKKKLLGVKHDELPAMAFNMLDPSMKVPYPKALAMDSQTILEWFDKTVSQDPEKFRQQDNTIVDTELATMLAHTQVAGQANFTDLCLEEGVDSMLLLYSSEVID